MKADSWYVYAIYSKSKNMIYVGMSEHPNIRLKEHNSKKVRSTKAHTPWELFFAEYVGDRVKARELEKYYKTSSGKAKLRALLAD
jgi:putative endonuclease